MAGKGGVEPPFAGSRPAVLPLNDFPLAGEGGVEPPTFGFRVRCAAGCATLQWSGRGVSKTRLHGPQPCALPLSYVPVCWCPWDTDLSVNYATSCTRAVLVPRSASPRRSKSSRPCSATAGVVGSTTNTASMPTSPSVRSSRQRVPPAHRLNELRLVRQIRTVDLRVPNAALYQAEPPPVGLVGRCRPSYPSVPNRVLC